MRSVVEIQTKFKFGDRVIVKSGFYRGMSGKVHDYFKKAFQKENYHLVTDIGNMNILVTENQIEIVGVK